jgi:osmoprotectant transport system ATP-binding protein
MIVFENVTKAFSNNSPAVRNLSVKIEDSETTVIIGPSGCGKTTTLRMVNRLVEPSSGNIMINGISIKSMDAISLRRSIGYVIQEIGLFPHYNVFDNIAIVPVLLKWRKDEIKKRVFELLELVNLPASYSEKYPAELSGGERQRVGVARALASDPEILLMDEPFGAIDPINRKLLQDFFIEIQRKIKKTVLFVTHDIDEAIKMGDNMMIMNEGKLVQFGKTKDVINHPSDSFVENLIGADRSLRKLMLLRAGDYAKKNFVVTDAINIKVGQIKEKIFLVKRGTDVIGYFEQGDEVNVQKDNLKANISVYVNDNLLDVFTNLLKSGKKIAVVQCFGGDIEGVIDIQDLIEIIGKTDGDI